MELKETNYCDVVLSVEDTYKKHCMLAQLCTSAIMIGGGSGTKHIESEFLKLNKPVVALKHTQGIIRSELDKRTKCVDSVEEAINLIH